MKKILENLYVFSKLTISITLLFCLLGVLYIFYLNYKKESEFSQNQSSLEQQIVNDINKNSELINEIVNDIKVNEIALLEIKKNIELLLNQENKLEFSNIDKNIKLLNENFKFLSKELKKLKDTNTLDITNNSQNAQEIKNNTKNEVIDIILIKFQNNKKFIEELNYLRNLFPDSKASKFEKISILASKPYKGHEHLKKIFSEEANNYFKVRINKNPDSFFSKIFLPYLDISPSSENNITDDLIVNIKEIEKNIENRNIDIAYKNLKNMEGYNNFFTKSLYEINKYIDFKKELFELK